MQCSMQHAAWRAYQSSIRLFGELIDLAYVLCYKSTEVCGGDVSEFSFTFSFLVPCRSS